MIDIGSSTGHKIGILLVLITLTIGSTAAISWISPSEGEFDATVNLSVNPSYDDADLKNVTLRAQGPDQDSFSHTDELNKQSADNYTIEFSKEDISGTHGDYEIKLVEYNTSDGSSETSSRTFTLDGKTPNIEFGHSEYVQNDPAISVDIGDKHTGVNDISASANNDASVDDISDTSCDAGDTCTVDFNIDTSDLSAGDSFDLDITATDDVGNEGSNSQSFTFDNSYDAGTNPDFEYDDSHIFELEDDDDDQTVEITVDGGDDETANVRLTCYDGSDDQIDRTDYEDLGDSDESHTFECDLSADEDDYGGKSVEMYVELEDEAGNIETLDDSDETMTYYMDLDAPSVSGLEIPSNANLYNSNFDVEFIATDDATSIEEVEYYFDSGTDYGDGTGFDSVDQDSYEIDTSDLSEGDHTLYVRAKDEADRWSTAETVDFSFDPDAVPEIALDVPETVSVTAGEQGSFDVTVENTGEIHVSSVELSGSSGDFFSDSQSISDLESGQSVTATLDIDTGSNNLGEHTIEVSTDNPSKTEEIDLVVEANEDQQDQIDSDLSEQQSKLQDLEANVTSLKNKVSEDKRKRLESNFSEYKQKVEDAQAAVDSGDYYKAESILEGIDQDHSAADSSYEEVKKEYENNRFWMLVFLGLGGIVVLGGGAIGALSYTDEVDFDIRDYLEDLQEVEFDASALEKYADKIKRLMEGKDTSDAEDFQWDGFDNN